MVAQINFSQILTPADVAYLKAAKVIVHPLKKGPCGLCQGEIDFSQDRFLAHVKKVNFLVTSEFFHRSCLEPALEKSSNFCPGCQEKVVPESTSPLVQAIRDGDVDLVRRLGQTGTLRDKSIALLHALEDPRFIGFAEYLIKNNPGIDSYFRGQALIIACTREFKDKKKKYYPIIDVLFKGDLAPDLKATAEKIVRVNTGKSSTDFLDRISRSLSGHS
jgi:hypothetical protein